jgi:hypothetical protein
MTYTLAIALMQCVPQQPALPASSPIAQMLYAPVPCPFAQTLSATLGFTLPALYCVAPVAPLLMSAVAQ